jgi:hypothetical protein
MDGFLYRMRHNVGMEKRTIGLILLGIILSGFIIGLLMPRTMMCTQMGCPCTGPTDAPLSGERPCNGCSGTHLLFVTGILNVARSCSAQEVIICQNGDAVDTRYDERDCRIKVLIFFWEI